MPRQGLDGSQRIFFSLHVAQAPRLRGFHLLPVLVVVESETGRVVEAACVGKANIEGSIAQFPSETREDTRQAELHHLQVQSECLRPRDLDLLGHSLTCPLSPYSDATIERRSSQT